MIRPSALAAAIGSTLLSGLPALAAVPSVATDTPITQSLVAMVMGDLGSPTVLMSQGGDPHHYQMRPSEARALAGADLLVWTGPALTPWLDRAADERKGPSLVLLETEGTHLRQFGPGESDEDEDEGEDEASHDHDHDHDHDDHGDHHHDGTDPHAWLDPSNARTWVAAVAAELAKLDPEHAATYAANAAATDKTLATLDAEVSATLAPAAGKPIVVFHDAYGYFREHFGLDVVGTLALGDAATPGAARLAELRETIATTKAACAFPEANHDPKLMETLVEGTGTKLGAALAPEGGAATPGPGLYAETLRKMAAAIADCVK
ncbi:zinc ABC transporter substrate-binding protein [Frigidibacter sp. MR17.14]|uniref:zinc ABC transporter substrate-binding protein n=1 Tax=Frigidibacter sp. MR17.14 TaxID=3126509 RepID=UPI003012E1A6